jgi:rubrerythrin
MVNASLFGKFLEVAELQPQNPFRNDLEILNYALTLEHLENAFYRLVNASGRPQGKAAQYLTIIGRHEQEHVDALTAAISQAGGTPVRERRSYNFAPLGDMNTQAGILQIANVLEPTGVAAYDGAARFISSKAILGVAGSIVQVEARHAAAIKVLIDPNANPVPDAFEKLLRPAEVLAAVTPLLGPEA